MLTPLRDPQGEPPRGLAIGIGRIPQPVEFGDRVDFINGRTICGTNWPEALTYLCY